jgi:hypothetical protein
LAYFMVIWYIIHRFGTLYPFWYIVPVLVHCTRFGTLYPFWYVAPRKIWQPWLRHPYITHCCIVYVC